MYRSSDFPEVKPAERLTVAQAAAQSRGFAVLCLMELERLKRAHAQFTSGGGGSGSGSVGPAGGRIPFCGN